MAKLIMVEGWDFHDEKFTAFILCNAQESKIIEDSRAGEKRINLSDLNIICTMAGHNITQETQDDIQKYHCEMIGQTADL